MLRTTGLNQLRLRIIGYLGEVKLEFMFSVSGLLILKSLILSSKISFNHCNGSSETTVKHLS